MLYTKNKLKINLTVGPTKYNGNNLGCGGFTAATLSKELDLLGFS